METIQKMIHYASIKCPICKKYIEKGQERVKPMLEKVGMTGTKTLQAYHYHCFRKMVKIYEEIKKNAA